MSLSCLNSQEHTFQEMFGQLQNGPAEGGTSGDSTVPRAIALVMQRRGSGRIRLDKWRHEKTEPGLPDSVAMVFLRVS